MKIETSWFDEATRHGRKCSRADPIEAGAESVLQDVVFRLLDDSPCERRFDGRKAYALAGGESVIVRPEKSHSNVEGRSSAFTAVKFARGIDDTRQGRDSCSRRGNNVVHRV